MKKHILKRFGLEFLQHILACCVMVALATILFHSYLTVQTMDGARTYSLAPLDAAPEFEESDLFRDIFQTGVADITRLVAIKGQLETDGVFDPDKMIDVTEYVTRRGTGSECPVTAVYELEDLIKWGKYGAEYTNRAMSMSDFVNYFGPACSPDNFTKAANGQLQFAGFYDAKFRPEIRRYYSRSVGGENTAADRTEQDEEEILALMQRYTEEQLEDMAFSYIMSGVPDNAVEVSREDDGSVTVYFSMLNGRYETVDKQKQIKAYAGNWIEYMQLQNNIADAISSLSNAYDLYQNCNDLYQVNSNLKYAVRVVTDDGVVHTYTNLESMAELPDNAITDYFSEYRRHFIYYPDNLEFMGNTSLTEADISNYLKEYDYAYPENTHIWVGVDTNYEVQGDAFYSAHILFDNIVPNITGILITICFFGILWLVIAGFLTMTAGVAYGPQGEEILYLSWFDRIWTEALGVGFVLLFYGARYGYSQLLDIADTVYENYATIALGVSGARTYEYGMFGIYGACVSFCACTLWFSLVRRIKSANLWADSLVHVILVAVRKSAYFVLTHQNMAVSTLLPYNAYLVVNFACCFGIYLLRGHKTALVILVVLLVFFDGLVGVLIFRHNGEWMDIIAGIKRIRDGEVEYKLDAESLHGANREIADAVNNIGDGIHKAVNTSMKDEQMKTDLITNVSHDIKTPLTSIINYVDLLKRSGVQEEPAKSYIDILDSKSQRLKQLTDDLVEASKLSSGNIEFQMEKIDLAELLNQVVGELSERLEERGLIIVLDAGKAPSYISADSRRMWRVMENLFNNVYKYTLENTRVYIDLIKREQEQERIVEVSIKNISERQMNIKADDLTERFIRGDSARTTEGSGLGLYITKNLVEAQNGTFEICLDGDLFKAVMQFPEYVEKERSETK